MKLELEPVPLTVSGNEITDAARAAARAWLATQLGGSTDGLPYSNYLALSGNEITDAKRTAALQGDGLLVPNGCGIWEAATNLIPNGGAETDATRTGVTGVLTCARSTAFAKFGAASFKLTCASSSGDGYTFWHSSTSFTEGGVGNGIPVTGGATYMFSAWVKVPVALTGPSPVVKIRVIEWNDAAAVIKDNNSPPVANLIATYGTTFDWVRVSYPITVQPTTTNVSLRVNINTGIGDVYVDGIQCELRRAATNVTVSTNEITDVTRAANVQGDGRGYARIVNLVPNGGFETNTTGWTVAQSTGTPPTLTRVTGASKFGSACADLVVPSGTNGGAARFNYTSFLPFTTYTVSFWYRAIQVGTGGSPTLLSIINSPQATGAQTALSTALDNVWRQASITFTTDGTSQATSYFDLRVNGAITGVYEYQFDGVQMELGATANAYVETNGASASQIQGAPDSSYGIWEGTTNLVKNGGAETDASNLGQNNCTVTSDGTVAKFGTKCFKVVANGVGAAGLYAQYTVGGNPGTRVPINAGATYCSSAWIYSPGQSIQIRPSFEWYDATGTQNVPAATPGTPQTVPANTWTLVSVTGTAPANAVGCTPTMYSTGTTPPNGTVWFVDGFQVEQRRTATVLAASGNEITDATRLAATAWLATQSGGSVDDNGFYFNLCGNPSFETDLSLWVAAGTAGTVLTRDTTQHQTGVASLKAVTTGLSGQGAMYDPGLGLRPTCVPGQSMNAAAYFAGAVGGEVVDLQLEWLDASGAGLGSVTGTPITLTTGFTFAAVSGVAPASTASCRLRCRSTNAATITFFLDAVIIETGAVHHTFATRTGTIMSAGTHITRLATNLFRRGQCDATTDIGIANAGSGMTFATDATNPAPFSPQSIKCVSDGTQPNVGPQCMSATAQAAPTGQVGVGSIWFKGVAGASYACSFRWGNTDATSTVGTVVTFNATGTWQLVAAPAVAVAAGKTGDQLRITIYVNGTRAETFWVAHAMLESLAAAGTRSDITPYVATSGGTTASRATSNGMTVAPGTLINPTQGWMAIRVRIAGPSGSNSGTLVSLDDGTLNNRISLTMSGASWQSRRVFGGVGGNVANISDTHVYGDTVTGIVKWDAANVAISINGAPFVSVANAGGAFTPSELVLGGGAGAATVDGNVLWAMCGTGTLVDADAATLNALGNTDPNPDSTFGATQVTTLVWSADGPAYTIKGGLGYFPTPYVETNGAAASRTVARVQAPSSLISTPQFWWAARFRVGVASTLTGSGFDIAGWGPTSNAARFELFYRGATNDFRMRINDGVAANADALLVQTLAVGDVVTVIGTAIAGRVGISVNGSAFATTAHAISITPAAATFDIGSIAGSNLLDGSMYWFMCGTGTLTNADAATLNALGNTDPNVDTTLGTAATIKAVWTADAVAYVIPGSNATPATPYIETNGALATRGIARVQAPASFINGTQSWVAVRARWGFGSAAPPTLSASQRFFALTDGTFNNRLIGILSPNVNNTIRTFVTVAGVSTDVATSASQTFNAGDLVTAIFMWDAGKFYVSVNGGAFTSINRTQAVPPGLTTLDIGNENGGTQLDGNVLWFACGTGTLTNANAAALAAMTSLPDKSLLPGAATLAVNDFTAPYLTVGGQKNGFGIWEVGTNLFRRGQCDATSDWATVGAGVTNGVDATVVAPFSPQSIKITCDGTAASQGAGPQSAAGQAAAAATVIVGSVYFKGVAGQSYFTRIRINNTDASVTDGTLTNFAATGAWQLITPLPNPVAAGKTGDSFQVLVRINGQRAESFWLAHAMIQRGVLGVTPYIATSGGQTATRQAARVQAPAAAIDPAQSWVALRLRMGWQTGAYSTANRLAFMYGDSDSDYIDCYYEGAGSRWVCRRQVAGSPVEFAAQPQSFVAGDGITVIGSWDPGAAHISVNGIPFVTAPGSGASALAASLFDVLSGGTIFSNLQLDANVLWLATGTGRLTDADAAYLNKMGDTGPASISQLPGTPTMLWLAADANGQELIWVAPPRGQFEIARLPFAEAQAQLAGGPTGLPQSAAVGWHGALTSSESGSFALVRSGGRFADLVGKRVQITHQLGKGRSVYAFVAAESAIIEELSLTRALFARLELLAADDIPALVQEVA